MNRIIKFRIWDKKRKRMYEVLHLHLDSYEGIWATVKGKDIINDKDIHLRIQPKEIHVMQFTGLTDKNGNDIYEGDILREPPKDTWDEKNYSCFEIFFHGGDANSDYNIGFSMSRMHNHGSIAGGYIPSFKPKTTSKMIICGNIYQNPELLTP